MQNVIIKILCWKYVNSRIHCLIRNRIFKYKIFVSNMPLCELKILCSILCLCSPALGRKTIFQTFSKYYFIKVSSYTFFDTFQYFQEIDLIPTPANGTCGVITHSDEIHGITADLGEHPWVAAIGYVRLC